MGFKSRIVAGVVVAGAVGAWFVWDGQNNSTDNASAGATKARQSARTTAVPVTVTKVLRANYPVELDGLGTVQPFNTVTVRTRVDGQILKIYIREGQLVKEGDLLLQIDPRPYQAALDQANAKEQQDQANLANATVTFQRDEQLIKQNYASRQQYDNDAANVRQLTALIASDKAAVFNAQTQVSYTEIHAPISGRTSLRSVDVGNIVQAAGSQAIMTIAQVQPIAVAFTAPEDKLPRIYEAMQKGSVAVTALTSDESRTLGQGKLSVINNTVDSTTGTIQLKAEFANTDNALWPGLAVATRMLVTTLQNVVVVPADAVQHGPNGLFAYVVDKNNKVEMRTIALGDSGSEKVVVTKGLDPGDVVVVAGQYRLQQGTRVSISVQAQTASLAQEQ